MITRDNVGDILAALWSSLKHVLKPVTAEAMALRKTMDFCIELGLTRLEGDFQLVMKDTNSM